MSLEPRGFETTDSFLAVDFSQLRSGTQRLISESRSYFPEGVNESLSEIVTDDGSTNFTGEATEALKIFDSITDAVLAIHIRLRHVRFTNNMGLRVPTGAEATCSLDLQHKTMHFRVHTVGRSNAEAVFHLLTDGIELVNVELPEHLLHLDAPVRRFLSDHPEPKSNIFLMMRFKNEPPFPEIVDTIRDVCARFQVSVLRADDKEYTADLLDNVLTYLYGCAAGIAIFDQINYREFNPNVAMEVGVMIARGRPVLLLKDLAIPQMPSDVAGKIYKPFNTYTPGHTIPPALDKWLRDYGIGTEPS